MQYLVSVENNSYFYWQLELLIESFLMHGLQDNLLITMAENEEPKLRQYSKNLVKYCKKIIHPNVGKEKDFLQANRIYAIRQAFYAGDIDLPFSVIHADMVLKNPIENYNKQTDIVLNNYSLSDSKLSIDFIENQGILDRLVDEKIIDNEAKEELKKLPFAMPIIFNESLDREFLLKFFDKLTINLQDLITTKKQQKEFPIERTCWMQTLMESVGFYSISSSFLSTELMNTDNLDAPFIHYKYGIPPIFNKKFFKFEHGKYFEGPFELLLEYNPTSNTDFVQEVIKSYLKRK